MKLDTGKLKDYVLKNYDQVTLFAKYLEIPEKDITYCLENRSNKIENPLRIDRDPSLGFTYVDDKSSGTTKIRMYDFADPYYRGDCFDLVGIIRKFNPNKALEFITICKDIIHTMKDNTLHHNTQTTYQRVEQPFLQIRIEPRLWNQSDIDRFMKQGLPFNEINHIIFPLKRSFISNYTDYTYDSNDPAYAWVVGEYENQTLYKIYFPNRSGKEKGKPRFKSNNKYYPLEGMHLMQANDILCITKGIKERLLLKRLLPKLNIYDVEVTNFTSETILLNKAFVHKLFSIYEYVVTNADFDKAGLYSSGYHKREYGILRFIPTNGKYNTFNYGGKDLCEIYENKGEEYTLSVIKEAYDYLKQEIQLDYENNVSYQTDF